MEKQMSKAKKYCAAHKEFRDSNWAIRQPWQPMFWGSCGNPLAWVNPITGGLHLSKHSVADKEIHGLILWLTDTFTPPVEPVLTEEEEDQLELLLDQWNGIGDPLHDAHRDVLIQILIKKTNAPQPAEPAQQAPEGEDQKFINLVLKHLNTMMESNKPFSAHGEGIVALCYEAAAFQANRQAPPATSEEDRELYYLLNKSCVLLASNTQLAKRLGDAADKLAGR